MRWIHAECELLKDWRRAYRHKETTDLDSPQSNKLIQMELRDMVMPPYDKPL